MSSPPLWKAISPLRGLAICAAVMNHATHNAPASSLLGPEPLAPSQQPVAFTVLGLLLGLTPACLHLFLAASGFFAFRFFRSPADSWASTGHILRKYLAWALPLYALLALKEHHVYIRSIGLGLLVGGPMAAYWFLVLLALLHALAPWLVRGVKERPRAMLGLAAALQVGDCTYFYRFGVHLPGPEWLSPLERCVQFLPFFVFGMWTAREAEGVSAWLVRHRSMIAMTCVVTAMLALAESVLLSWRHGFVVYPYTPMYALERAAMPLFSLSLLAWFAGGETEPQWLLHWLTQTGNQSLGILLMTDLFQTVVKVAIWHVPQFFSASAARALANHQFAPGLAEHGLWFVPLLFVAGLWGPLYTVAWTRSHLGTRGRALF